jgi:dipeptidyl aminopeptidase/acylaminoacyl peptidase
MADLFRACVLALSAILAAAPALAKPPLEAFGETADLRSMELSPDGKKVAYLARAGNAEQVIVYDLASRKQEALATTGDFKALGVRFAGDDYVILNASKTTRNMVYMSDKYEDSSAFAINIKTKKSVQLLTNTPKLYPAQSGLHQIVGFDPDGRFVYMPAFTTEGSVRAEPPLDLLRVSLETGVGRAAGGRSGTSNTRDWIIDESGKAVAREDYNDKTGEYVVRVYDGDKVRELYRTSDKRLEFGVVGIASDGQALIVSDHKNDSNFYSLYRMSLADGAVTGPILKRTDADIAGVMMTHGRKVVGVAYAGMFPAYEMFDAALDADIKGIQAKLPDSAVSIDSWSDDWSRLLIHISGGGLSERYALFDRKARALDLIAVTRPAIKPEDVGQVITIEYKAQDGLKIPALITWPTGIAEANRKNLPMIVLPHGGPEAYDAVGFDWMAQYFANEGYMVFQPNFRGSGGFGEAFARAGHGEWGRKMQSDITDGASALIRMGWADGGRTCIVGGSYGGYAALAGGAMTPDMYKCVVAIAGVADLREMMAEETRDHGPESSTVRYWTDLIGDINADKDAMGAVSPVNLASSFKAPVLLIHGTDDLTVPIKQSDEMEAALKKAGKDVTYLKLKGEDHHLSSSVTRRAALEAMSAFVNAHIGKPN